MDVLDLLITKFGSNKALADALAVGVSAISNWRREGTVPIQRRYQALHAAASLGIELTDKDLQLPRGHRKAAPRRRPEQDPAGRTSTGRPQRRRTG